MLRLAQLPNLIAAQLGQLCQLRFELIRLRLQPLQLLLVFLQLLLFCLQLPEIQELLEELLLHQQLLTLGRALPLLLQPLLLLQLLAALLLQ